MCVGRVGLLLLEHKAHISILHSGKGCKTGRRGIYGCSNSIYALVSGPILKPEDLQSVGQGLYPRAILRDDRNRVALLGDRAAELLDRIVIKLAERVSVLDLLVIVESSSGSLLKGKFPFVHCNGLC